MTNLILNIKTTDEIDVRNHIQSKLKSLTYKHPIILKSEIFIELSDCIRPEKQCTLKLKTQMSNFVVTSQATKIINAINECVIILNYQLTIMT